MVKSWEVLDKYTFGIVLKEPCAALLTRLGEYIIPKHLLAGKDIKTDAFNFHPIGTGPFRFKEWIYSNGHSEPFAPSHSEQSEESQGKLREESPNKLKETLRSSQGDKISVVLESNPDYYEGAPKIQHIIATGYDTEAQCWGAFMRGEINVIFFLYKENVEIAKRDPEFKTYSFPAPYIYGLEYNIEHPFFKDKKVRQAMNYAINTKEIINKMESGYGTPATGPFLPGTWSSNPDLKPIEYNPKHALQLLKDAGWSLNSNNILEKEGKEFRITMLVNSEARNGDMIARFIYQNLYDVGIRMDIKNFEYKNREEKGNKKLADQAELYLTAFVAMADPTEGARDWHSKYTIRNAKIWQYKNSELDRLLDAGQVTTNINQRKKIYYRINKILFEEQSVNFLYFHSHLGAVSSRFTNTDALFSTTMPFWTIKDWGVKN
jgi:peptide/nickel transport system substrate-binding protein